MPQLNIPAGTLTVGEFLEARGIRSARAAAEQADVPDKSVSEWIAGNDGYESARAKFCTAFAIEEVELFTMIDAGRIATRAKQQRVREAAAAPARKKGKGRK
jgi:hypothetical protein